MDRRDLHLCHCVELTCAFCGKMVRMARCQCDLDAEHLVEVYRRDIQLYDLKCPACGKSYPDPAAAQRVNRVLEDSWLDVVQRDCCEHGDPERAILVLRRGRGLSVMRQPEFCPHGDECPGSDCCEEGERCAKAADQEGDT